jgi:hypothetical protein
MFPGMLEYAKYIIEKMSFDAHLFEKELKKTLKTLFNEEYEQFKLWCYEHYGVVHGEVLQRCFV